MLLFSIAMEADLIAEIRRRIPMHPLLQLGPGDDAAVLRLAEMGIIPGARFRVMSKGRPGPFIIMLKQTRMVLGQGMVHRMFVRPA